MIGVPTSLAGLAALGLSVTVGAQEPARARPDMPEVGSTRLLGEASFVLSPFRYVTLSATVAPFVSPRWQLGLQPLVYATGLNTSLSYGQLGAFANYYLIAHGRSRPFVGVYVAEQGGAHVRGAASYGAQVGWVYFVAPSLAARAELRYRDWAIAGVDAQQYLVLSLDPHLFGSARGPVTLPDLGVIDVAFLADIYFSRGHQLYVQLYLAPFVTRWLQLGGSLEQVFLFQYNSGSRRAEGFGRLYAPLATRIVPYADGFLEAGSYASDKSGLSSFGMRGGMRYYVTPGVAFDIDLEWRKHAEQLFGTTRSRLPEDVLVRAGVRSQVRVARRK